MPELAFIGTLGGLTSLIFGAIVFYMELSKFKDSRYLQLQKNLNTVQLRWNDLAGDLESILDGSFEKEKNKLITTLSMMTGFAFLLSWIGLFFFIIIYISFKKIARGKKYHKLILNKVDQISMNETQMKDILEKMNTT